MDFHNEVAFIDFASDENGNGRLGTKDYIVSQEGKPALEPNLAAITNPLTRITFPGPIPNEPSIYHCPSPERYRYNSVRLVATCKS